MEKISVIIPAYNAEEFIGTCLDSVLNQSFQDYEVYICDDGSTDETREIVSRYSGRDHRFHCLALEHSNAGSARNAGMKASDGEYLYFLDADDYLAPDALEKLYEAACFASADVVVARSIIFDNVTGGMQPLSWAMVDVETGAPLTGAKLPSRPFQSFIGWPWDKLFSKSFVKEHNLTFQSLRSTNDAYFVFSALCRASCIICLDDELFYHRTNNAGSLERTRSKSWRNAICAMTAIRDSLTPDTDQWVSFANWVSDFSFWSMASLDGEGATHDGIDAFLRFLATVQMPEDKYFSYRDFEFAKSAVVDRCELVRTYISLRKDKDESDSKMALQDLKVAELQDALDKVQLEKDEILNSNPYRLARGISKLAAPLRGVFCKG